MTRKISIALALAVALTAVPAAAQAPAADVLTYSGFLRKPGGTPETAATELNFKIFDVTTAGSPIWASGALTVTPGPDGFFSVILGAAPQPALSALDFSTQLYLELQVTGEVAMTPRTPLTPAPRAISVDFAGVSGFPASTCLATQYVSGIDANGRAVCDAKVSPRSTGWLTAATASWGNNWGVGNNDLTAPGDVPYPFYAYVTGLGGTESEDAAISVYVDCTHSPAATNGAPECHGAQPVPFRRTVTNNGYTGEVEFRAQFDTDPNYARYVLLVVALKSGTWDSAAGGYIRNVYLPGLKFRGMVVPAQ